MSTGFKVLVFFHLACVVGGFGSLAYNGLYLSLARRRGGTSAAGVVEVNQQVSGFAELLVYGAFLFGLAAIGASHSTFKFGQTWVWLAFVLFLVDVAVLHGWVKRHQRAWRDLARELAEHGPTSGGPRPPEVTRLAGLEQRVSLGWGVFNLVALAIIYLMVFKPGGP